MIHRALPFLLILALSVSVALPASAQKPSRPFSKLVAEWTRTLDAADRYVKGVAHFEDRSREFRLILNDLREATAVAAAAAADEIAQQQKLLDALGVAPKDGEPPEKREIVRQRAKYEEDIAFYRARASQAEVAVTRADALAAAISELSRAQLLSELGEVNPMPFAPDTIAAALPDFYRAARAIAATPVGWWSGLPAGKQTPAIFLRMAGFLALAFLVGWGLRHLALKYFGRDPRIEDPTYARRLLGAIAEGVARGIFPALILGVILLRVTNEEALMSGPFAVAVASFCKALILLVLAWALPRAALAPELPSWRLTVLTPDGARTLCRRVTVLAAIVAADWFLSGAVFGLAATLNLSREAEALYFFIAHTVEAGGVLMILQPRLWRVDEEAAHKREVAEQEDGGEAPTGRGRFWAVVHGIFVLLAIGAFVASALGYGQLGAYFIRNLITTGLIGGGLYLARGLFRETVGVVLRSDLVSQKLAIQHRTRRLAKFWLRALLDAVIFVAALFLIAPLWGVPADDMWLWTSRIFQGFTIGSVTISLLDFAIGVAVFIAVIVATRAGQRALSERILPQTRLDTGLQHSLAAGFGYIGFIIAATMAVGAIGLDLTNIALIAGALSVGIGFGLQNIVNNFVSGLTLLVERPIKVGDWIVVGEHEGIVKRIQVRATEIETFQRTSVIVPNSAFLQNPVINRTHKDSVGRIDLSVGVAYGSDTAKVERILLDVAKANSKVSAWPEPFVLFTDFGESSLDFELRCFCQNVFDTIRGASELRFAIDRAFRAEGVKIPFPHREVVLKDMDRLERLFGPDKGEAGG